MCIEKWHKNLSVSENLKSIIHRCGKDTKTNLKFLQCRNKNKEDICLLNINSSYFVSIFSVKENSLYAVITNHLVKEN